MTGALYTLAIHAARLVAWPVLWWLGRRAPAFRERWAERRGVSGLPAAARGGIVVHAASMGEVAAAEPLVRALAAEQPHLPLVLTCTSPTASAEIRQRFGPQVHHAYLPFDTPGAVRRFLADLSPRLLLLMETELWPNLLREAQSRGAAVVVANARLSARAAGRYRRFRPLTRELLSHIDLLLVQDSAARERFLALGAAPARTRVTGSLKVDTPLPPGTDALQQRFRAMAPGRRLWVAASTHDGEEAALLGALPALRERWPDLLLVMVPRHPQRFDAVAALLQSSGLAWQRRSADPTCTPDTAVLLGDTMGELRAWFGLAQVVFMGGTLIERGGHNPLEVMQVGGPLVSGPHVFNFAAAFGALQAAQAVRMIGSADELGGAVAALLADPAAARAQGERGRAWFDRQGGATARSMAPLRSLLAHQAPRVDAMLARGPVCFDPNRLAAPARDAWFDAAGWPGAQARRAGRATVWFVPHEGREMLLRHYHRGGLVGRLLGDRYLRQPAERTRALAEFALLRRMRAWALPVPRPCAARVCRAWLFDRGDILVERIPGAEDLARRLAQAPVPAALWRRVGAAVARLHAHGVHHADLNCHNLLLDDQGAAWIVDFDKCELRAPGPWAEANLERLRRSLRKEASRMPTWHWQEADWAALRAGYDEPLKETT